LTVFTCWIQQLFNDNYTYPLMTTRNTH
jgi:hypothetical protein